LVFGELNWQRPAWYAHVAAASRRGAATLFVSVRTRPAHAAALCIAAVALLIAVGYGWRWYENRPKPVEVTSTLVPPALTCYACEPVGTPNPVVVQFSASVAPLDRVGNSIDAAKAGVELKPDLPGDWVWMDDKQLLFRPRTDWPIAQRFTIKFARKGFAAAHVKLAAYALEFQAPAFEARLAATEFHQDPVVATNKKVVATIAFTHPVDPESLEQHVSLRMFERVTDSLEKELRVPAHTIVYDKLKLNAYVHSAQLEVPAKSGRLEITIRPGVHAARAGNETPDALASNVEVPGLNSLKIADTALDLARNDRNEPNQVLLINTSFTVLERDLPAKVSAWLLPTRHPDPKVQAEFERYNPGQPFRWTQVTLRPAVLRAASSLALTQIPGEREHYELHSFNYTADPGRYVYVKIGAGLKSFGGYVLGDNVERILQVPQFPRELSIMHEGSLLAMSGDKTLSLFARNVPAMRIEVGRLLPRQLQHLVTQTNGNFATPQFHNWAFDAASITERFVKIVRFGTVDPSKAQYEALDLGEYLNDQASDKRGIFLLRIQAWDAQNDRALEYTGEEWNAARQGTLTDARLIVVTDLGLLVKRAIDGSQDVFVQSTATGAPVAGASVEIIGRNGLPVLSEMTSADGHVHFPELRSFQRERAPVLYLARREGDSSFLPLDERGRTLDMSRFEIGGVESSADRGALAAYLFSDRGLYRPGEEIRAAAIIRSQDWSRKLDGLPLRLEVTDPRGIVIRRETFVPGAAGFGEIRQQTQASSATGNYTLALSVVRNSQSADLIGSVTVQVREFQPDRLRMHAGFTSESFEGWVSPEGLDAKLSLENLFGTPAEQRRITAQLTLSPQFPSFRGFPDYQFYDPQFAKEGFSEALADTQTDAKGEATLALNLQRFARATYRLHVVAQGFEADGGRGVTAEAAQLVSSMPFLIGYKADGELGYLARDARRVVNLLAINPQAQRAAVDGLNLERLETRFVSVLLRQNNGTYKYESRRKETVVETQALAIAASGYDLSLATTAPGNYAYVVRDAQGQQLARVDYQVAGEGNVTRALEKNAELELALAKRDYAPGEDIEVSVRAPYAGAGLITIERERVYSWQWFRTATTSSVQRIKVPAGLEGNAYVAVTFVRDPGSEEIYTSPLSYGVQPFSIDVDARRNAVTVETPSLVKPGESLTLRYRTERPARIVLFAIDEGILQVANYQTPNPLGHFFQKRALEVSTAQILDLILPEFRHLGLGAAPGGDAEGLLGKHLNPFRRKGEAPVAFWSGILDADATTRELQYVVPDYFNGSLRVMAVAVNDERVGVHESRTLVRGDFVLSPNAPTTVTPGDEFDVSVGISNNAQGSGSNAQLNVTLQTEPGLEVLGESSISTPIAEGREGSVRFRLRARDELGASKLNFTARAGNASASRSIDLSIRPTTPFMTQLKAGVISQGEQEVAIDRTLYPQYRKLNTGMSVLPLQFAHGFASYLANYPYACTEQLVSMAMPAVLLQSRPEFGYVRAQPGSDISGLISELRARQGDDGGYKLWPGSDTVVEFVSLYAQHLLLEAGERGEAIPADLTENGNSYLRKIAARDGNNLTEERQSAYAIYLLTRQGQRMTAEIAAQRKRLTERYRDQWQQDLTAAWLAAAFDLMQQQREAEQLIRSVRFAVETGNELYYDAMTRDAFLLFITARHFPERLPNLPVAVLTTLAQRMNEGYYHSLSAGTTLLALDAYSTAATGETKDFSIAEVLRDRRVQRLQLPAGLFPQATFSEQATALRFGNHATLDAYYSIGQSGFDRKPPREAIKQGLEVIREYTDAAGKPLGQITMGQQVDVHLKFRGLKSGLIDNVALVDLLPGGFELVVPPQTNETPFIEADEASDAGNPSPSGWQCQICIAGSNANLSYADTREDRVVFYVNATADVQQVIYRIKATNVGTYTVPPAYGEALYDRSVVARSTAGRLSVTRAQ
jgi:uncharacterized protein YfaS (alpha-2-macroglobulin family)